MSPAKQRPRAKTKTTKAKTTRAPAKTKHDPEAATFAAAAEARRGNTDAALVALRALSDETAAAAAAVAEIEAFRGNWQAAAEFATRLLARPDEVYAANIFEDCAAIVRRAAHELRSPRLIDEAVAAVPKAPRYDAMSAAVLRRSYYESRERDRKTNAAAFAKALAEAPTLPRLKGKPDELRRHCFALAASFHVDAEIMARWDAAFDKLTFDSAILAAQAFMRAGRPKDAWSAISSRRYWPVEKSQVAPVVLVVDPLLIPLMTPTNCEWILSTPRGPEAE